MEGTFIIPIGDTTVTLYPLTASHYWRTQQIPPLETIKRPELPDGFTHDKALEFVEDYRREWNQYEAEVGGYRLTVAIGAARIRALDSGTVKRETEALARIAKRYTLKSPDEAEEPFEVGDRLAQMVGDITGRFDFTSIYGWMLLSAGGVDPEVVDEVIKRLRAERDGEGQNVGDRGSDLNPSTSGGQGEPASTEGVNKPVVRPSRRSAKVGNKARRNTGAKS